MTWLRLLTCLLLLLSTSGCTGSAPAAGYAARVMEETDTAASALLPAVAEDLDVQIFTGLALFVECDLTGWRYQAEGDLLGDPDPEAAVEALTGLLQEAGFEVEVRDDGSLIGRRGELSLLIGRPGRPTQIDTALRHYSFTHACTPYGEEDVAFARTVPETDYTGFVPPAARYVP